MLKGLIDVSIGLGGAAGGSSATYSTLYDTNGETPTDTTGLSTSFTRNGTSFTTPAGITVIAMRLSMRLWSPNVPSNPVIPEIWNTSGGTPTTLLQAGTGVDCSDLPASKPGTYNKVFEVTGLSLSPNTQYAFVLAENGFSAGNSINLQRIGNVYAGGNHVARSGASTWLNITGSDLELLLEYGE